MTERDLKKMSREQLLEMLLTQTREVTRLQQELDEAKAELDNRMIRIQEAGSIAEAAMKLSGIFEDAQKAADQYLFNLQNQEQIVADRCRAMEEQSRANCEAMIRQARAEVAYYWDSIRNQIKDPLLEHQKWMEIQAVLESKPRSGK